MPIQFRNTRDCFYCGAEDSIRFINKSNEVSKQPHMDGFGTYQVRCISCGKQYIMNWDNGEYIIEDKQYTQLKFTDYFSDHDKRDIDSVVEREYELPDS